MSVLYVTKPGAVLTLKEKHVQVGLKGEILASLPIKTVERVVTIGAAQVSGAAAVEFLKEKIPLLYCSGKGRYYGMLHSGGENVEDWLKQVECWQQHDYRLAAAKKIVQCKLANQRLILLRQGRNHRQEELKEAGNVLRKQEERAETAVSLEELRGIEGYGAKVYFSVFGGCLHQTELAFDGRSRRPPLDPVNSLLSFGYALLLGEVVLALREAGLHTGLGFLHEPSRRREALALDLMELFRQSIVDRFILRIVNLKMFKENDFFVADEEGVRLNPEAMPRFFAAWEEQLGNKDEAEAPCGMRAFIRREVKALKREICSGEKWQPQKRIS